MCPQTPSNPGKMIDARIDQKRTKRLYKFMLKPGGQTRTVHSEDVMSIMTMQLGRIDAAAFDVADVTPSAPQS